MPSTGPVILVSRHFHYLWDGVLFLALVPRPVRILVALDWVPFRPLRAVMEVAVRSAGWPAVLRSDRIATARDNESPRRSAYRAEEGQLYLRSAVRDSVSLLLADEVLAVFPEGYPVVDPVAGPHRSRLDLLPFRDGYLGLAQAAQRAGSEPVALVPVGLRYSGARDRVIDVYVGAPEYLTGTETRSEVSGRLQRAVRALSGLDP